MDDEQSDLSDMLPKRKRIKYPTFNQYVTKIGGDNARFSRRLVHEMHDNNTYFAETITKWNDQDYGSHYTSFINEIPSAELQTYAQLIHHKKIIIDCLVKYINDPENKSIPAFCEVLSSLVRDLKDEFYVHMWDVFTALINVLDLGERDIESVEAAFFTLTLLFKILWKKLRRDAKKTFSKFIPLFGSSREYVRRFASDAFAFLMRKLRDLQEISSFIVNQAHKVGDDYLIDGCAVLFFHTYKGLAGGFHSLANELLLSIINGVLSIEDNEIRKTGALILEKMVVYTIEFVTKGKNGDPTMLENTLLNCMERFESMEYVTNIARLLPYCYVEKNCQQLFTSEERLFHTIEKLLSSELCELNKEFIEFIAQSILRVFSSEKWNLHIQDICEKIIMRADDAYEMVIDLFLAIKNIPHFDLYIMPAVGKIAEKVLSSVETVEKDLVSKIFRLYALICLDRRPLNNILNHGRLTFFDITRHTVARNFLLTRLNMLCDLSTCEVAYYVITWPWMFSNAEKGLGLDSVYLYFLNLINSSEVSVERSQLSLIVASAIYQINKEKLSDINELTMEEFVRRQNCCESSLRVYRLFIEAKGSTTDMEKLKSVADLLFPCFFNPNSSVRRTAIEILCSFNVHLEGSTCKDGDDISLAEPMSMFNILLAAEKCDLIDSRRRLMYFRKLLYGSHIKSMPRGSGTTFEHIILRIGLSQFFVQFTLLWPGMHELLESFARGMAIDNFWGIMSDCFAEINNGCRMDDTIMKSSVEDLLPGVDIQNRSNFLSARIQLLKFTAKISDLAERRTRFLSPIFLELFEKDFDCLDLTQRLGFTNGSEHSPLDRLPPGKINKLDYSKTLCAFLDIYSRFNDAKSVFLEPKISEMYRTLLTVGIATVQRSTMACIYSYKIKAVNQYREYFDNILEERAFRDQLVLFKINEEDGDSVIHPDHRETVMPFLLRVLYGKLRMKTKKAHMASRRVAIFRYLGGFRPNELRYFLDILFAPILDIIGNVDINYHRADEICSEKNVLLNIDLGQINSALENVSELLMRIARIIVEEQQRFLFRLLLAIAAIVRSLIILPDTPKYLHNQLKDLRMSVADRVGEFFAAYPLRTYYSDELRSLQKNFLLPFLTEVYSIDGESISVPPLSIIKILTVWSKFPSLYHLYALRITWMNRCDTLMDLMINPLTWSGLTPSMLRIISGALWNLLTMADEKSAGQVDMDYAVIPIIKDANYGTSLVVYHIKRVVRFLAESIENNNSMKISTENLNILNKISDYVSEGELGCKIAFTLLSHLERKIPKNEVTKNMLNTLARLVKHVNHPEEFIRRVGPLFSQVEGRTCRESLMSIVLNLSENTKVTTDLRILLKLVADLDSWDKRKVEEPDHERRHASFTKLFEIWSSNRKVDKNLIIMFTHTYFFTLSKTADISLRSSSSSNLRALIEHVGRVNYEDEIKRELIDNHFIPVVLRGFRCETEVVREESVRCLVTLIDNFPLHSQLKHMNQLRNNDCDLDFFANAMHIQIHRRQRAIHKLADQLKDQKVVIPFEVLNKFFIPLIHPYLVNVTSKSSALSDECLRLLNITLTLASWSKYISYLDYWMNRLNQGQEGEKPIIRIIVTIIDAFHFDVAEAGECFENDDSNKIRIAVRNKIVNHLLPKLSKCINGKAAALGIHKKARTSENKYYNEDDDIQRAPVALATVKLLMKLPSIIMNQHLHGVILKLCSLMISRSMNVRDTARKVTIQVCECLGPKYLPFIIKEMKLIMNKGFQLHVMIFTVHTLIFSMHTHLSTGDLDSCLTEILEISIEDQFEDVAEEKEVGGIKGEVSEAKGNKTPETFLLLGRLVSAGSIGHVLDALKRIVDTKTSAKVLSKISNLLSKFVHGLKDNQGLTLDTQLILIHQVLTINLEQMETLVQKKESSDKSLRQESCLILPIEPRRVGALVKTSVKSRAHVFVEFALQLLSTLITGKRFDSADPENIARLDPFVSLVTRCLTLKYSKINSFSLRCITGMLYMNLPSLKNSVKNVSERLFVLLSDYSVLGNVGNKHTILQLNQLIYKGFTQIINISDSSFLTKKHISLLLSYAETDLLDSQKQATAFSLIKAIIKKRIIHERIPELMKLLSELSITSTVAHIRAQCRDTLSDFIGNHPNSGNPKEYLEFFLAQLEYEHVDGRLSAVDMLHLLFNNLLQPVLNENCMFCVVKLAACKINSDIPKCKAYVAAALRMLLQEIGEGSKGDVYLAACDWLESDMEGSRAAAVEVLVELSHVEKARFATRLTSVLPLIIGKLGAEDLFEKNSESTLSGLLDGLVLILHNICEAAKETVKTEDFLRIIAMLGPMAMCHDSSSICRAASSLIGQFLSLTEDAFWTECKTVLSLSSDLIDWMCWQLRDKRLDVEVADQASKNIVFLSSILPLEDFCNLLFRLASICKFEIVHQPRNALKRISCFKLSAALGVRESGKKFDAIVDHFLPLFVREMNRKSANNTEELYNLAMEIGDILKKKMGEQEYENQLAKYQMESIKKSEDRKRRLKELSVTAPAEAAEMKRKKHIKKVEARKRKLDQLKPYRVGKRKHIELMKSIHDESD